ncbi:serine-rich adhesin for platelets-like [Drosophila madeirensis]|uniref:Serine-rich adhesin for platelets-like n=1 Tax=Drosophila madeirensis TaxID=30013 RepID=A0AAU9FQ02_DROMD
MGFPSFLQALLPFTAFFGGKCGKYQKKVKETSHLLLSYRCVCRDGYVRSGKSKCVAMYIPPYSSQTRKIIKTTLNTPGKTTSTTATMTTGSTTLSSTTEGSTKKSTTRKTTRTTAPHTTIIIPPWFPKKEDAKLTMKNAHQAGGIIFEENQIWSTFEPSNYLRKADFLTPKTTTASTSIHIMNLLVKTSTMTTPFMGRWKIVVSGVL